MSELVANCPRCGAKRHTFDLTAFVQTAIYYDWQKWYEAFCVCRNCHRSTVFVLAELGIDEGKILNNHPMDTLKTSVNALVEVKDHITLKDSAAEPAPEHLPPEILAVFNEGAKCLAIGCNNAAGTMFRLCLDLATRGLLPGDERQGLNARVRRDLGLRLPWLFENKLLDAGLQGLSACIKDDGNDGAHAGTLTEEDAADIVDFTRALLERLYTEPAKLRLAEIRRKDRRKPKK